MEQLNKWVQQKDEQADAILLRWFEDRVLIGQLKWFTDELEN